MKKETKKLGTVNDELGTRKTATPFFSIIVPVYNVAPYLRECLDSVLAQTFTNWECLCVDDGSTDESGAILDEYAQKDPRFRIFHKKNGGVAQVRQLALMQLTGKWMIAIDADDRVESSNLKDFYSVVNNMNVDMVWCNYFYNKNGSSLICSTKGDANAQQHIEMLLKGEIMGSLCNHLLSVDFIRQHKISFPPKGCNVAEDLCFLCHFLTHCPKVKWLDVANYHYVYRSGSLSHRDISVASTQPFVKTIRYLCDSLAGCIDEHLLRYKKMDVKFGLYDKRSIPTGFFLEVFPEVKDVSELPINCLHKICFWLAVRGMRRPIIFMITCIRKLLKV